MAPVFYAGATATSNIERGFDEGCLLRVYLLPKLVWCSCLGRDAGKEVVRGGSTLVTVVMAVLALTTVVVLMLRLL